MPPQAVLFIVEKITDQAAMETIPLSASRMKVVQGTARG
jgi:hypothetical protein